MKAAEDVTKLTPYARRIGPKRLNPAILRTCKTVHDEARKVLYRPFAMQLRPAFAYLKELKDWVGHNSDVDTLKSIAGPFKLGTLVHIHRLSKLELEIYTTPATRETDIAHPAALIKSFRGRIPVGKLDLKVFCTFFDCCDKPKHKHGVERATTAKLIKMWSKILVPKELKVLVGSKPGLVMECCGKEGGSWSRRDLRQLNRMSRLVDPET